MVQYRLVFQGSVWCGIKFKVQLTSTLSLIFFFGWQIVSQKPHISVKCLLNNFVVIFIQFWVQYQVRSYCNHERIILACVKPPYPNNNNKRKQEEVHPSKGFKNLEISSSITNTQHVQIKSWFSCHIYFFIFDNR